MLKAYLKKMIMPTAVMAWAFSYYLECQNYKLKSRRMITIVFFMMLALYVINGLTDYFELRKEWKEKSAGAAAERKSLKQLLSSAGTGRMVAIFLILVLYVLCLDALGFILTTLACSLLVLLVMGERKWYMLTLTPIILVVVLYLIFNLGLRVPLPKGILTML